jgi:hypothetical protein
LVEQKRSKARTRAPDLADERTHIAAPGGAAKSSFIRTVTVGSGIEPDLLTTAFTGNVARSRARGLRRLPPVGNSTPP